MGDCSEWTEESDYEILGRLSHLRHLRLEQGPATTSVLNYLTSLNQITGLQHLELINFTVNAPLDQFQLSGLKRLLVVPRYAEEVGITFLELYFLCFLFCLLSSAFIISYKPIPMLNNPRANISIWLLTMHLSVRIYIDGNFFFLL